MMVSDWSKVRHFKEGEFGPRADLVAPELIIILDEVRERAGVPLRINCAWAHAGHSEKSYHYTGQAVDMSIAGGTPMEQYCLLREFRQLGGIGYYPEWNTPGWHIDLRSGFLQWVQMNGAYIYGHSFMAKVLGMRGVK